MTKDRNAEAAGGGQTSFETSLARLEAIVRQMEGGELSLEKMMAHFEEGTALIRECSRKLNEVEKKIEMLVKKSDGSIGTEPFTGEKN